MNKEQYEQHVRNIQQRQEESVMNDFLPKALSDGDGDTGTGVSPPPVSPPPVSPPPVSPPPHDYDVEVVITERMADNAAPFHKDVFNAGIEQAHKKIEALREKYRTDYDEKAEAAEEAQIKADFEKYGEYGANINAQYRAQQEALNHFQLPAPVWQQHTGLFPDAEKHMSPNDRAARINKLLRIVERMVKYEMKNGNLTQRRKDAKENEEESVIRRTHLWDPLRSVCFRLEISQARLSRYSKEITGMSATEIVDCVRMERARKEMKANLKKFIQEFNSEDAGCQGASGSMLAPCSSVAESNSKEQRKQPRCSLAPTGNPKSQSDADEIWAELKTFRRAPRWHRSSWAAQFGFSSYGKFFRACLLVFGATPHEIEIALIDEILAEDCEQNHSDEAAANQNRDRKGASQPDSAVEEVVKRE